MNRPSGTELADGPELLGEGYRAAANRLACLGLLRELTPSELVRLLATITDAKSVAAAHRIKLTGRRPDMCETLLVRVGPEAFPDLLRRGPYYVRTPQAQAALLRQAESLGRVDRRLKDQLIEALVAGELRWALLLWQDLLSLHRCRRTVTPQKVCETRLTLENPIPGDIRFYQGEETVLRAVAAASNLCFLGVENEWHAWRTVRAPTRKSGEVVLPIEFASAVWSNDGASDWEESSED